MRDSGAMPSMRSESCSIGTSRAESDSAFPAGAVEANLQRANAERGFDDARHALVFEPCREGVRPEVQGDVEHMGAELNQEPLLAGPANDEVRLVPRGTRRMHHRILSGGNGRRGGEAVQIVDVGLVFPFKPGGMRFRDRDESDGIAGRELTPVSHRSALTTAAGQTKPPKLGPSGPKITGMSPVKSTLPEGVRCIVNVRRMQTGFAAVRPRPDGLRTGEPHAGAAGVVVHLPTGRQERLDIVFGKEVRGRVRTH